MTRDSYTPVQIGIKKEVSQWITYAEQKPAVDISDLVYCFWKLKTDVSLKYDFIYTVMPDACIDVVFDATGTSVPIIMTPKIEVKSINLGKEFHYIGIRFKPGVFNEIINVGEIVGKQEDLKKAIGEFVSWSDTDLQNEKTTQEQYLVLAKLVKEMMKTLIIKRNPFIENVVRGMQYGLSVNAIAQRVGYSTRHLRRKVIAQTGFSPVQLRRVLRFQMALSSDDVLLRFADQSHLIKEFKAVTGISYNSFTCSFNNVRKVQS